jgi:hypothetical protein
VGWTLSSERGSCMFEQEQDVFYDNPEKTVTFSVYVSSNIVISHSYIVTLINLKINSYISSFR